VRCGRESPPRAAGGFRWCAPAGLLVAGVLLADGCSISINEDEPKTVREQAPTVTERTVIERAPEGPERERRPPPPGGTVADAIATVEREGYDVTDTNTYDPSYTVRVLIGIRKGSATAYAQKAFFFLGSRYLGTDTKNESAGIDYAGQEDLTVSLTYALYRPEDPNCCPAGGEKTVRYHWNGARLIPLDGIPSDSINAPLSRR
jgi:hypothetical protein